MKRGRRIGLVGGLLALVLPGLGGCLCWVHPVPAPAPELAACCRDVPLPCRSRVHVFFLQGVDPLDASNLEGVRSQVRDLGFIKTWFGQSYHAFHFAEQIRKLHRDDPEARFVLVGFSLGAQFAHKLARELENDPITIDLLVSVEGVTEGTAPGPRPENVLRVVGLVACEAIDVLPRLPSDEQVDLPDVRHFGAPTHPTTLALLASELAEVARRVPLVEPPLPPPPGPVGGVPPAGPGQAPAPVLPPPVPVPEPSQPGVRGEWDFLRPDGSGLLPPGATPYRIAPLAGR